MVITATKEIKSIKTTNNNRSSMVLHARFNDN